MKNNLLKLFLVVNGILAILAGCPSYPTIPATSIPKTNPKVLTSASEGMISLNPSLTILSITMTVTLDEECVDYWNLFTLTVTPSGDSEKSLIQMSISCDTFDLNVSGDWFDEPAASAIFTGSSRTVTLFASIDLESRKFFVEVNTADKWSQKTWDGSLRLLESGRVLESGVSSFDETTKLYLCSWRNGAPTARACTISRLQIGSTYPEVDYPGYLGDFTPVSQAFYPLINGKLSSLIKSADSAYFGDKSSSPSSGTSPSWDSSNSFVQITSETQFLTLPIPSVTEDSLNIPTMTLAFWVRVTSIPQDYATLFSVITENGKTLFSFVVSKETLEVGKTSGALKITLNTWQLISCSLYSPPGVPAIFLSLSVGDSKATTVIKVLDSLATIQIGDSKNSFIGDISSAQILSPGAGYLTTSDTCSPNNVIEINSGPYAISCAEGSSFNPSNNKCYSSCPTDTDPVTPFTDAPFTLCLSEGAEEPSTSITVEESGGLSGGAIAGIAVGSVAGVAALGAIGYLAKIKIAKIAAKKAAAKAYQIQMSSPTTETIPTTTTNMVAP